MSESWDDFLSLTLHTEELKEILAFFYTLTGIRVVIFNAAFKEILAYPETKCQFCRQINADASLAERCNASNRCAFEVCKKKKDVYIYKCHAGLVEAAAPIRSENQILGYIMFGQITDEKDKSNLNARILYFNRENGVSCSSEGIKYKSRSQIVAAARLLEVCTAYILQKDMIQTENDQQLTSVKAYIHAHLAEKITIEQLCRDAEISRTQLYAMFQREMGVGIAAYIREERLKRAKSLLQESDLPVAQVSVLCGIADYNYFSRLYKKRYGVSPHKSRK